MRHEAPNPYTTLPHEPDTMFYHSAHHTAEGIEPAELARDYSSWATVGYVLIYYIRTLQSEFRGQRWQREAMINSLSLG